METERLCATGRRYRLLAAVGAAMAAATLLGLTSAPAAAHRAGKAIPSIRVESAPADPAGGLTHEITVTIVDADSPSPVSGADVTVEAKMTVPHSMTTLPTSLIEEDSRGVYKGRLRYPMPAEWTLVVYVKGSNVQEATAELPVTVTLTNRGGEGTSVYEPGGDRPSSDRPTVSISGRLTSSDAIPVASLAAHGASAAIWAIATVLLVLAAHPKTSRWLSDETKKSVLKKRSPVRLAAVIAGVFLVITGVANGAVAAPFRLVPTVSSLRAGMEYPFGSLYLLVLAGKIIVLIALVIVNRMPSIAPDAAPGGRVESAARLALWADVVLFPLLLVLITLLRYLHVLVHVALAAQ